MDVRSFILTTGQEIIAQVIHWTDAGYEVRHPLVVHMMRGQDGAPTLGFGAWSLIRKDGEITIFKSACLTEPCDVEPEVAQSYMSNVTGIILPSAAPSQILHG